MMHDEFHPFRSRVVSKSGQVEIRIRCHEIEYTFLHVSEPVFPSDIPSFYQDCIKSVVRGEINVFLYIFRIGSVPSVGIHSGQVIGVYVDTFQVIRI